MFSLSRENYFKRPNSNQKKRDRNIPFPPSTANIAETGKEEN
jgi:hypothetical protein